MMEIESPARLPTSEKLTPCDSLSLNALAQHTSVSLTSALHSSVLDSRSLQPSSNMVVESSSHESEPALAQPSSPEPQLQEEAADVTNIKMVVKPTADDVITASSNNNSQSAEELPETPSLSPPEPGHNAADLETGCSNSPRSVESCPEKQRSRRKPTLEDIVRRMKTTDTYCSEDSEEEMMNGSLTIDMARGGVDEVDGGSTDMSCQDMDTKDLDPHLSEQPLPEHLEGEHRHYNGLPVPQLPPHVIDNLEHQKENQPLPPVSVGGGMPSSMPMASNISETAFSPHAYAASKINSWFHGSFNGLPLFPFPPSPLDHNLARKFLPFESKIAAEVEKDYLKCQYCERTFRRQKNLENHIENTHQGKGPVRRTRTDNSDMYFKCTHCPYTTKHQSNLYVHLRIHTGERPYICGACGVQYSQSHSLKSHIINKHDGIMSYYIKEKRTRSPRGMGYLATQIQPESPMFKMPTPPIMSPHMQQANFDLSAKSMELKTSMENLVSQPLPISKSSPVVSINGHASPHYADLPHNRSPGSMPQTPTNGHLSASQLHTPQAFPMQNTPNPPTPITPTANAQEETCGAIDLSKKTSLKEHMFNAMHDKYSRFHDKANCANCLHSAKLRMLRLNVVRMLSILVPNLNFEEKGISAESDSVDELLQDVIESNTQEEDMAE